MACARASRSRCLLTLKYQEHGENNPLTIYDDKFAERERERENMARNVHKLLCIAC